jgi:hypothetical protein
VRGVEEQLGRAPISGDRELPLALEGAAVTLVCGAEVESPD